MAWIKNRIHERKDADQQLMDDSLLDAAKTIVDREFAERKMDDHAAAIVAIEHIMRYYRYETVDVPESVTGIYGQLDFCLRPHGVMYREVKLDKDWYKDSIGPIMAYTVEGGMPIALMPGKIMGY